MPFFPGFYSTFPHHSLGVFIETQHLCLSSLFVNIFPRCRRHVLGILPTPSTAGLGPQRTVAHFGIADRRPYPTAGSPPRLRLPLTAPEVLLNHAEGYTFAVDMWSIGVILYVLYDSVSPEFFCVSFFWFRVLEALLCFFPNFWRAQQSTKEFSNNLSFFLCDIICYIFFENNNRNFNN